MGYATYLILRRENEDVELFESNNTMPLFWIGLLDHSIISDVESSWMYYDKLVEKGDELDLDRFTDIMPSPMWFDVDRVQFEANSGRMSKYLKSKYPELSPLFSDFVSYIQSKFDHEENEIMIDVAMLANMDGAMPLLSDIYDEVNRINKGDDLCSKFYFRSSLITSTTGFGDEGFKTFSPVYNQLNDELLYRRKKDQQKYYPNRGFSWKSLIWFSFLLLLCPFFTVTFFLIIKDEGVSFWGIVGVLSNIGFYGYSIYHVRKQFLLLKKRKKQ